MQKKREKNNDEKGETSFLLLHAICYVHNCYSDARQNDRSALKNVPRKSFFIEYLHTARWEILIKIKSEIGTKGR